MKQSDLLELIKIIYFTENLLTQIHGLKEPDIYKTITESFTQSKNYNITILKLTSEKTELKIVGTSFIHQKSIIPIWEKIANVKIADFRINLIKSVIYSRVINKNEALCVDYADILKELFPDKITDFLSALNGYQNNRTIVAPLHQYNEVIGAIAINAPSLTEHFIPTVVYFIKHISTAIEFSETREYLAKSEKKYKELVEKINEITIASDNNGIIQYISPQISQLGYNPQDFINRPAIEFIHPEDRDHVIQDFQRSMTTGEEFPTIFRIMAKDGRIFWFEDFGKVQYDENNNIIGLTGILRNITERKNAEEKAKENEEFFLQMMKQSPYPIQILSIDGTVLMVNVAFIELFGFPDEQKLVENYNLFKDPFAQSLNIRERIKDVFNGKLVCFEIKVPLATYRERRYGSNKYEDIILKIVVFPVLKDKKIWRIALIYYDITEQKNSEKKIKEKDEILHQIIEQMPFPIAILDEEGVICELNKAFVDLYKIPDRQQIIGNVNMDIFRIVGNVDIKQSFINALNGEVVYIPKLDNHVKKPAKKYNINKKQELFTEMTIFPVFNINNKVWRVVSIGNDITKRIKDIATIKRLNEAIEQSNDCIAIHRLDGIIYYANKAFLDTFKYSKDDLKNKKIKVYNTKENYKVYRKWLDEILKKGSWSGEQNPRKKDGTVFYSFMSAKVVYNEKGEPVEIIAILKDITELYKQKNALEQKNIALKEVLSQLEMEKRAIRDEFILKIERLITPSLNTLRNNENISDVQKKKLIDGIFSDLYSINSSAQKSNRDIFTQLSTRETEICNMVKKGIKNKEVASILNISLSTVENHKKNIRKKLGIGNQPVNLRSFLERMY